MSPGAPAAAIDVRSVFRSFGRRPAVSDVSFTVAPGNCFALLGPNGAGKSTTLKMVCGLLRPTAGRILVAGTDVAREPRRARRVIGIAPQDDLLDSELTVEQNLVFHGRYHGLPGRAARARARALLHETGLEPYAGDPIHHLSSGLRRRLVLARALLNEPRIVVLDEPTRGLDRESRLQYFATLGRIKAREATLLLATHDLAEAEALGDHTAFMERGRIVDEGPLAEIVARHGLGAPGAASPGGAPC